MTEEQINKQMTDEQCTEPSEQDLDSGFIDSDVTSTGNDSRILDEDQDDDEMSRDVQNEPTIESVIEAILFASDEPLSETRIADIVESGLKQVRQHIDNLNKRYETNNSAFRIEQIAGGYQMLTLNQYNHWLKKLLRVRGDSKLSTAAMETLAIIAYKQPVMRADIEAIRGVAAGDIIRSLCYKGLVKIVGRAEVLGRPMLYGTTKKFLELFGLNSLKDLPKIEELKKPPS
jgi:segregation and condensation protein B